MVEAVEAEDVAGVEAVAEVVAEDVVAVEGIMRRMIERQGVTTGCAPF